MLLVTALWALGKARNRPGQSRSTERWALTWAGAGYLGLGGAYLIRLRAVPDGLWWTLTACSIVWIGDSAAYFVGKRWGRHKMAPTISPGKSWEGYAAQVLVGTVAGGVLVWCWSTLLGAGPFATLDFWGGVLLGVVISLLCPAGDFLVSMMKREAGVKDTSHLIPGHGGVFDRIDSLLWAGILGHWLASLFG
jgi:phosphatidate cytidylyltransferase